MCRFTLINIWEMQGKIMNKLLEHRTCSVHNYAQYAKSYNGTSIPANKFATAHQFLLNFAMTHKVLQNLAMANKFLRNFAMAHQFLQNFPAMSH